MDKKTEEKDKKQEKPDTKTVVLTVHNSIMGGEKPPKITGGK